MSGAGTERRQWPRIPAALLSNVTASIMAGPDVKLVNLSRGGALMEVAARYPMRSKVRLKLTRSTGEVTQVPGTVSWAKVASIDNGRINYLLAVIFENPIEDLVAATGVEDIESQALAATTAAPDYGDDAVHAVQSEAIDPPSQSLATTLAAAEPSPLFVEEALSTLILSPSDPVTVAPAPAVGADQDATAAPARDLVDRAQLTQAESRVEDLRRELDRASVDVAALSATNDTLSTQLRAFNEERIGLRSELEAARRLHEQSSGQALADQQALAQTLSMRLESLEAERQSLRGQLSADRQQWDDERSALAREAAEATARAIELQGDLKRQELEQTQALDEARVRHQSQQERLEALELERGAWSSRQEAERQAWQTERATLARQAADAIARIDVLEESMQSRQDEQARALAEQQALTLSLTAQLEERRETIRVLESERSRRDEEQSRVSAELHARMKELQTALEARERIHTDAIAEQQGRFEGLIAELVQTANDQQAEYQELMAERTEAFDEQVTRAERLQAELDRVRVEAERERTALDLRCQELAAQLEAAEAVAVAQESRYRAVREEASRLVALLTSPVQPELPVEDIAGFRSRGESTPAVAGG